MAGWAERDSDSDAGLGLASSSSANAWTGISVRAGSLVQRLINASRLQEVTKRLRLFTAEMAQRLCFTVCCRLGADFKRVLNLWIINYRLVPA